MLFLKEDIDNAVNGRLFPDREEDDKITNGPTVTLGGQLDTQLCVRSSKTGYDEQETVLVVDSASVYTSETE